MTLHQSVRHPFARALANLRQEWDQPGVDAAIAKLSQTVADPGQVLMIALQTALNPGARLPEAMLHRDLLPQQPSPPATPTPASLSVWCERHGCNAKVRDNGELSCCWQERIDSDDDDDAIPMKREGFFRRDVSSPPPDFRERVEKAMAGVQAKETAGK